MSAQHAAGEAAEEAGDGDHGEDARGAADPGPAGHPAAGEMDDPESLEDGVAVTDEDHRDGGQDRPARHLRVGGVGARGRRTLDRADQADQSGGEQGEERAAEPDAVVAEVLVGPDRPLRAEREAEPEGHPDRRHRPAAALGRGGVGGPGHHRGDVEGVAGADQEAGEDDQRQDPGADQHGGAGAEDERADDRQRPPPIAVAPTAGQRPQRDRDHPGRPHRDAERGIGEVEVVKDVAGEDGDVAAEGQVGSRSRRRPEAKASFSHPGSDLPSIGSTVSVSTFTCTSTAMRPKVGRSSTSSRSSSTARARGCDSGDTAGTVDDALASLRAGGVDHGCALNSFELPDYPFPPAGGWPPIPPYAEYADELRAVDEWICEVGAAHPELLPFITVNPAVLQRHRGRRPHRRGWPTSTAPAG